MRVERLPEDTAAELLDAVAPGLAPAVRSRVLSEAAGNPLALTELPAAVASLSGADRLLPAVLPLTARLERAFTARVAGLPAETRTSLLIAVFAASLQSPQGSRNGGAK